MTTFNIANVGRLRPMCDDDLELVLSWRNAPNVRKNMYSQDEIALSDHLRWWANINESPQDAYFVFEQDVEPLGVVSFTEIDLKNQSALWAFYASPSAPKGTGSPVAIACAFAVAFLGGKQPLSNIHWIWASAIYQLTMLTEFQTCSRPPPQHSSCTCPCPCKHALADSAGAADISLS